MARQSWRAAGPLGRLQVPTLWIVMPSLDGAQRLQDLEVAHPPGFEFVNCSEVHAFRMNLAEREYADHGNVAVEPLAFNGVSTPSFRTADRRFALDYFDVGVTCASSRLRRVLKIWAARLPRSVPAATRPCRSSSSRTRSTTTERRGA